VFQTALLAKRGINPDEQKRKASLITSYLKSTNGALSERWKWGCFVVFKVLIMPVKFVFRSGQGCKIAS
jgi:hypothetical protein